MSLAKTPTLLHSHVSQPNSSLKRPSGHVVTGQPVVVSGGHDVVAAVAAVTVATSVVCPVELENENEVSQGL